MYGIINKAIKDLVLTNFGEEAWEEICFKAKGPSSEYTTLEVYDDKVRARLLDTVNLQMNRSSAAGD